MVTSVAGLGRRLLTERRGRAVMTTAGIVLGVALFTGSLLTTGTATQGLDRFAEEVNGQAEVVASPPGGALSSIVSPRTGRVPASAAEALAADPDVQAAIGLFAVPTAFEGPTGRTEQRVNFRFAASLVGADLDAARSVYVIDVEAGRLPTAGADELVLPADVAAAIGVVPGDPVVVTTPDGPRPVPLVGVLSDRGLGRLDRIGFTSLETARRLAGEQDNAFSQVAVDLRDDVDADAWIDRSQPELPAGVVLSTSGQALSTYRDQIGALNAALVVLGGGLLATAAFLIYLTLSMSVAERTRLYGTMLAIGATRRQVRRVVLTEALVVGAVGTTVGLVLGIGVAAGLLAASSRLLQLFARTSLVVTPGPLLVSAAVGMAVTVASTLVPASRAAGADPVAAIAATDADHPMPSGRWLLAAVVLAVGGATLTLGGLSFGLVGLLLVGVGAVRLVPHLVRPLARVLGPLLSRLSPGGGRVAVQHLVAERTRSAYTLALVMVVMAMTVAIATIHVSFTSSLERQLTAEFGDDLQISAAATFPESFLDDLVAVEGVAAVTPTRDTPTVMHVDGTDLDVFVTAIDPDSYFDVAGFPFTDGDAGDVVRAFQGDEPAVVVPAGTADRLDLAVGDVVAVDTLQGPRPFEIVALVESNNIPGRIVVSDQVGIERFGMSGIDEVFVRTVAGVAPEEVRSRIEDSLGDRTTFIVTTGSELKADTRAQIGGGINAFWVLLVLAGVVGTFGLANTMAVSVFKRYREIGVLRAIGAKRRQIRGMAVVEAGTLVAVALVLAVPLGVFVSRPLLDTTRAQIGDLSVEHRIPWLVVPALAVVGIVVAFIAAIWPANRAARLEIDDALRFE